MLPIRWDPFKDVGRELSTLHREMDDLFRRTFGLTGEPAGVESAALITPAVNTYVKNQQFCIDSEIPGVSKDDMDVSVEGNVLTLRGERKVQKEINEQDYMMRESRVGAFVRRLTLPEGVNTEKIHASYENGILHISMPLEKQIGGRKVLIEGAGEGEKAKKEIH